MFKKSKVRKVSSSAEMELPAAKTTIVGGRPPGSGKPLGPIPRGIEVLVKKASVDPTFKALLLARRSKAADEIGLLLEEAEAIMLDIVLAGQLEAIIAQTRVEPSKKPAFLGKAAAVMLVALGASAISAQNVAPRNGVRAGPPQTTTPADPNLDQAVPVAGAALQLPPRDRPASGPATTQASRPTSLPADVRAEVDRLISQLDDENFQVRKAAQDKLTDLGLAVVPILKQAVASGKLSLEARTRVETIINKINPTPTPPPRVIEQIGARPMPPVEMAGVRADVPAQKEAKPDNQPTPKIELAAGVRDPNATPKTQPATAPASRPVSGPTLAEDMEAIRRAWQMTIAGTEVVTLEELKAFKASLLASRPATHPAPPTEIRDSKGVRPDRPAASPTPELSTLQQLEKERVVMRGAQSDRPPTQPATQASQPASAPGVNHAGLAPLLKQLDADDFKVRAVAQQKLLDLGLTALPALREASKDESLSLEVRNRVKTVVSKLRASTRPAPTVRPEEFLVVDGSRPMPPDPAPDDSDD